MNTCAALLLISSAGMELQAGGDLVEMVVPLTCWRSSAAALRAVYGERRVLRLSRRRVTTMDSE
jgi:hypothetical protein